MSAISAFRTKSYSLCKVVQSTQSACYYNKSIVAAVASCNGLRSHSSFACTSSNTTCWVPKARSFLAQPDTLSSIKVITRGAHSRSEGDQQFLEFLGSEISSEKQESKDLPSITGFKIKTDGPNVILTKKINAETVTVNFNVNNSVSSTEEPDEILEQASESNPVPPEMLSHPDFTVILAKDGTSSRLALRCQLIDGTMVAEDIPEDEADQFEIVELAMLDAKEWTDDTYSINADLLDANMYDMLMLLLEERGVNHSTFTDQLIQFSTEYEHTTYVKLLEKLQAFVKAN